MKRGWWGAVVVAVAGMALGLTGCTAERGEPVRESVVVREERGPVERRFPAFGEFVRVRWVREDLNSGRAPGPSDVRMAGVVQLSARDADRLRTGYAWREGAEAGPSVPGAVGALLPDGARWRTSEGFAGDVTRGGRYAARFHVDFEMRVLVFDALNPDIVVDDGSGSTPGKADGDGPDVKEW
ncbi:hypothetical protein ACIO3O_32760 [Streptomyces sp. NPDC087440]|uniref:hypothetical protein n=1 Tax=Streptomyces sp. NPDC087440 TaxID=3365790 RepID=UPI003808E342